MKYIPAEAFAAVLLSALLVPSLTPNAQAKESCSLATLNGGFGFTGTGTVVMVGPVASVGRQTFDGEGNTAGIGTFSRNGSNFRASIKGTYTVDPDCTGDLTLSVAGEPPGHSNMVIDDGGMEFRAISTDFGTTATIVGRKQFPEEQFSGEQMSQQ